MLWACVLLPQLALDAVLRRLPDPDAPLALVWLDNDHLGKGEAGSLVARDTARRIAAVLSASTQGQAYFEKGSDDQGEQTPLKGGDIAVLVASHRQASEVAAELAARGVPSVRRGKENVWHSEEAAELSAVLAAYAEPGREGALRYALASRLLGRDAAQLARVEVFAVGQFIGADQPHVLRDRVTHAKAVAGGQIEALRLAERNGGPGGQLQLVVEQALGVVQSLDPTGVGARTLAECIALQAREADRYDPCMARLIDNLELLAARAQERGSPYAVLLETLVETAAGKLDLAALRIVLGNQAHAERRGYPLEMNLRVDFATERVMR